MDSVFNEDDQTLEIRMDRHPLRESAAHETSTMQSKSVGVEPVDFMEGKASQVRYDDDAIITGGMQMKGSQEAQIHEILKSNMVS